MSNPSIHDDLPRHDVGTGYGPEERAEAPPRPAAVPAVPPMEAEWLRAVSGRPASGNGVHAGPNGSSNGAAANGAAANGAAPNGVASKGAGAPPAAGNGPSAGGVDGTRDRH